MLNSMVYNVKSLFHTHFEWAALSAGLIVMILLDPSVQQASWCLFEQAGITFCPGEGLGHSIALFVRGDVTEALNAHFAGPFAVFVVSGRIIYLICNISKKSENSYG